MRNLLPLLLGLPALAQPPADPRALFDLAVERHYALRQYDVEVRTSTVTGDRPQPSERVRIVADEEARAFQVKFLTGDKTEAISDGDRLWVRSRHGVADHPAEGPDLRVWLRGIETRSGRFALLGRSALDAEWRKWETVKRGKDRIRCGVIRIRPSDPQSGIWTEMLWIEAQTGLIWRTVWIDRTALPGGGMHVPPAARGGGPRQEPMISWDTVRTREYHWLHTEGELPAAAFAKPAWAARAK